MKGKRSKRPAGASPSGTPPTPAKESPAPPATAGATAGAVPAVPPEKRLDPTPPKPVVDVMPGIVAAMERAAENSRQFKLKVEAHVRDTSAPRKTACPHKGPEHELDIDKTCERSWGKDGIELVYAPCAKCRARELTPDDLWLFRAGAPKKLLKASFDNWTPRLASDYALLKVCREFAARPSGLLVLQGGVGLGKTHLGVAIMRAAHRGRMMTQNHFLLMLRETYRNERAPNPIEICKGARLLVFDELGVSTGGRDEFPALYEVLNDRYANEKPTVFTTNVPTDDFDQAFGYRISDRLATAQFCIFKGESWRKPK